MKLSLHIVKKRTLPITWLLLGLLTIYPMAEHAWSGIVLCIGADGHIELEDGRASDCATKVGKAASESHYDHAIAEIALEEFEDCGPCVDVALLMSPLDGQRTSKLEANAAPDISPHLAIHSILTDNNNVSARLPNLPEATASHFFTPLRKIALLI